MLLIVVDRWGSFLTKVNKGFPRFHHCVMLKFALLKLCNIFIPRRNDPETIQKRSRNDLETIQKRFRNDRSHTFVFPGNIFTDFMCRWRSWRVNNSRLYMFGLSETKCLQGLLCFIGRF